jgi:L-2-hydroxyglutarate oxidase LhgO
VLVLEREPALAAHQSGRNSGVVHSGVYYAPGSLRAQTCVTGARLLERFCAERGVPLVRRGKVIVATREDELPRLDELLRRGRANGVAPLHMVDSAELAEVEPGVRGLRALHLPEVASVDFAWVSRQLAADIAERGGEVRCSSAVERIDVAGSSAVAVTAEARFPARVAILCAGLWSDRLARACGAPVFPRIVPFRGDFWLLRPGRDAMVRGHVYPVPDPALPFLGVHATRRADGSVWLGPSSVLALTRDGYHRGARDLRVVSDIALSAATLRLLARHWRHGVTELLRDHSRRLLVRALQRFLPELTGDDLLPGPRGIRAQAISADGRLLDDFVTWRRGPVYAVRNAPSPAATAALAIAQLVAGDLDHGGGQSALASHH